MRLKIVLAAAMLLLGSTCLAQWPISSFMQKADRVVTNLSSAQAYFGSGGGGTNGGIPLSAFNLTQFNTNGGTVSVKSSPSLTGVVASAVSGTITNNTTGNAATASAGWPTTWPESAIIGLLGHLAGKQGTNASLDALNLFNAGLLTNLLGQNLVGKVRLNGSSSGYTDLTVPNAAGTHTLTFPNSTGNPGDVFATDGAGNISFVPLTVSGTNGGIAELNGSTNAIQTIVGASGISVTTTGATHTIAMSASTLTPGNGLSGLPYDVSANRTWTLDSGVTNDYQTYARNATNDASTVLRARMDAGTNALSGVLVARMDAATNAAETVLKAYTDAATNALSGVLRNYAQPTNNALTVLASGNGTGLTSLNASALTGSHTLPLGVLPTSVVTNTASLIQLRELTAIDHFYIQDSTNNTETTFYQASDGSLSIQNDAARMSFAGDFSATSLAGSGLGITSIRGSNVVGAVATALAPSLGSSAMQAIVGIYGSSNQFTISTPLPGLVGAQPTNAILTRVTTGSSNQYNGSFVGDGGGLTNIPAGKNYGVVFFEPAVVNFMTQQANSNVYANVDILGAVRELQKANVWTNLVAAPILKSRFGTNAFDLLGTAMNISNRYYDSYSFLFQGSNSISVSLIRPCTTNTIVVVLKAQLPFRTYNANEFICGLVNTNNHDAKFLAWQDAIGSYEPFERSNSVYSLGGAMYLHPNTLAPLWVSGWNYLEVGQRLWERKVLAYSSDSAGVWRAWQDSVAAKFGDSSPTATWTSAVTATGPFTTLYVGQDSTNSALFQALDHMNVAAVMVFDKAADAALIAAAYKAMRWLEPETEETFWMGDSRIAEYFDPYTNAIPFYYHQQRGDWCWHDTGQGGQGGDGFLNNYVANGGLGVVTNLPMDKVSKVTKFWNFGINDLVGSPADAVFQNATNSVNPMSAYGGNATWLEVYRVATNSTGVTWSPTLDTNIIRLNNLAISSGVFLKTVPFYDFVTPFVLTNPIYCTDGTHLRSTNGNVAAIQMANLCAGQYASPLDTMWTIPSTNRPFGGGVFSTDGTNGYWATVNGGGSNSFDTTQFAVATDVSIKSGATVTNLHVRAISGSETLTIDPDGAPNGTGNIIWKFGGTDHLTIAVPGVDNNQITGSFAGDATFVTVSNFLWGSSSTGPGYTMRLDALGNLFAGRTFTMDTGLSVPVFSDQIELWDSNKVLYLLTSDSTNRVITSGSGSTFSGLYASTHVSHGVTNDNTETSVWTTTLGAGDMGNNGTLRISMLLRARDSVGVTYSLWATNGGTVINLWTSGPGFNSAQPEIANFMLTWHNRNAANSQIAVGSTGTGSFGTYNQDFATYSMDTAVAQTLGFWIKSGSSTATTNSFEVIDIEVLKKL